MSIVDKKFLVTIGICLIITVGGVGIVYQFLIPKIGYVRSGDILLKYHGILDAEKELDSKLNVWKNELLQLSDTYESELKKYEKIKHELSQQQQANKEKELSALRAKIEKINNSVEEKAFKLQGELTEANLNKINDFIQTYGKKNEFELIIGITKTGNVLYGNEGIDLTDEIIEGLNAKYK